MITFTSSSLYLWRIQALKPLTVGVKGPKRIHEILTLGTSATREDVVEAQNKKKEKKKKTSLSATLFCVIRKTFTRQNKVCAWKNMPVMSLDVFTAPPMHKDVILH